VVIGAGASVWFNTVVRGDTARIEIGAGTNLQDLTMVHVEMASHGRRGLSSILLGSETAKVLTHSKVPVLVVR
jgi:carbonic anhydrase/acetyltransferase-like protein (isoleucine patch superfamily)